MAGGGEAFGGFLKVLRFFDAPEPHAAPVRDGDAVAETLFGFAGEDEGVGEETVADGILRGGAGGGDLEFGSGCFHYGDIVACAKAGFRGEFS
jgi:hypothetical protein